MLARSEEFIHMCTGLPEAQLVAIDSLAVPQFGCDRGCLYGASLAHLNRGVVSSEQPSQMRFAGRLVPEIV